MGLIDGDMLVSYVVGPSPDGLVTLRAQWFDEELQPVSEDFVLGAGLSSATPEWAAHDGALWAQVWGPPVGGVVSPIRRSVGIDRLSPRSTTVDRMSLGTELPVTREFDTEDLTPISIGASAASAGADGRAPAAVAGGGVVFALTGIPSVCPDAYSNFSRIIAFDATRAEIDLSGTDPCLLDGSIEAHDMRLVSLRDGGLGVFFRLGISVGQGFLHYSRIDSDLRMVDTPPHRVDTTTVPWSIAGGFQPQAVALGSGTLLFTLRNPESSTNECQDLRLVEPDGSSPRDAPYQMRCRPPAGSLARMQNGPYLSQWVVVEPLASGHAVMAYGERTNYSPPGTEYARRITASTPWEEGVFLHTIDDEGRRASEIVRVTDPESTAMVNAAQPRTRDDGPFPGEFEVQAVTEGDDVIVVWSDNRLDVPGYYARRFRCTSLAE